MTRRDIRNFYVPKKDLETYVKFKAICKGKDRSMSEEIMDFIRETVALEEVPCAVETVNLEDA